MDNLPTVSTVTLCLLEGKQHFLIAGFRCQGHDGGKGRKKCATTNLVCDLGQSINHLPNWNKSSYSTVHQGLWRLISVLCVALKM